MHCVSPLYELMPNCLSMVCMCTHACMFNTVCVWMTPMTPSSSLKKSLSNKEISGARPAKQNQSRKHNGERKKHAWWFLSKLMTREDKINSLRFEVLETHIYLFCCSYCIIESLKLRTEWHSLPLLLVCNYSLESYWSSYLMSRKIPKCRTFNFPFVVRRRRRLRLRNIGGYMMEENLRNIEVTLVMI